jgi:thiosulfate/3-mercaptopyruvate sulfurtransferase
VAKDAATICARPGAGKQPREPFVPACGSHPAMISRRVLLAAIPLGLITACDRGATSTSDSAPLPTQNPLGPMLAPADLAKRVDEIKAGKIAVFYVGPDILFEHGHVPGARKLNDLETDEGYQALVRAISETPKDVEIVVYCGCCPYRHCPNVRPASKALRASGRTNAKYLDLPENFKTDWKNKGFPIERS